MSIKYVTFVSQNGAHTRQVRVRANDIARNGDYLVDFDRWGFGIPQICDHCKENEEKNEYTTSCPNWHGPQIEWFGIHTIYWPPEDPRNRRPFEIAPYNVNRLFN